MVPAVTPVTAGAKSSHALPSRPPRRRVSPLVLGLVPHRPEACGGARLAKTQPVIPASAWSPSAISSPIMPAFLVRRGTAYHALLCYKNP